MAVVARVANIGGEMHLDRDEAVRRAAAADHGVLATLNRTGVADLVPVCFAIVGEALAVPVDSVKPKRSTALGRIRNLERDPRATLLIEHWDPVDWSRLWWVRLALVHRDMPGTVVDPLEHGLRDRYPQYAGEAFDALLTFEIESIGGWSAT
jgi:PPOX class probable F420-dependent enzyme